MTLPLPDPLVNQLGWEGERTGVQRNFETIAQRFPLGPDDLHFGGTVTALPTGIDEGFEINYIASASAGVVWRFKYLPTTSGTYPWLFIGGPPLWKATTANTAYGHAAGTSAVHLSQVVPLAGDYDVDGRASLETGAGCDATVAVTNEASLNLNYPIARSANGGTQYERGAALARLTGLAASGTVAIRVHHTALGAGSTVGYANLAVRPVRVA